MTYSLPKTDTRKKSVGLPHYTSDVSETGAGFLVPVLAPFFAYYNNNIQDNVYGAVVMAEPLLEFTRFI